MKTLAIVLILGSFVLDSNSETCDCPVFFGKLPIEATFWYTPCILGPDIMVEDKGACWMSDKDHDGDVDMRDYYVGLTRLNGGIP